MSIELPVYAAPLRGFMFYRDFHGYQRFAPLGLFVCKPQRGAALVEKRVEFIQSPSGAQRGNFKGRFLQTPVFQQELRKEALRFSVSAGADPFRHYRRKPSRLEENLEGYLEKRKNIRKEELRFSVSAGATF